MSMLSAQADELRDRAHELKMLASGMDAPYIVPSTKETMALAMASAASEMREAADTIMSLRDRLQETVETCELTIFADVPFDVDYEIEGYGSGHDYAALAECSKCGAYVIVPPAYHHVLTYDGDEVYQPYRYCPNCRREVVDA